jgi:hypothetical protein
MTDPSYSKEATRGEDVEAKVDEDDPTGDDTKPSSKHLYEYTEEERMPAGAKLKLYILLALFTCAILGSIFLVWWIFTHVLKRTIIKHNPVPGVPTPAPTVACTKLQEVMYKMGLISSCS